MSGIRVHLNFYDIIAFIQRMELGGYQSNGMYDREFDRLCKDAMRTILPPELDERDPMLDIFIYNLIDNLDQIDLSDDVIIHTTMEGIKLTANLRLQFRHEVNSVLEDESYFNFLSSLETLHNYYLQFAIIQSMEEGLWLNRVLYDAELKFILDMGYTYNRNVRLFADKNSRYTEFGDLESSDEEISTRSFNRIRDDYYH